MFQRRKALTQVQAIVIVVIVAVAGVGAYLLGLIPGTTSILNPGSSTTLPHSTTPLPALVQPGTTKSLNFMYQGYNRTIVVHISKIYDSNKPQPLIIFFHGGGGSPYDHSTGGFSDKVDQSGGIAVFPFGYYSGSWTQSGWYTSWTPSKDNPKKIDDDAFTLEIIYRLKKQYNIDSDRIYAAGHSAGGFMSYDLGAVCSDVFAAIAPQGCTIGYKENVASSTWLRVPEPKGPISVIHFQGTEDEFISYYGGVQGSTVWASQEETIAFWVRVNGCSTTPKNTTSIDGKVVTSLYSGGKKGTEVVHVAYIGGGHGWVNSGINNATDMAWNFFMSHPKLH